MTESGNTSPAVLTLNAGSSSVKWAFIALPKFSGFSILNPFSWVPIGLTTQTGYYKAFFFYYLGSAMLMGLVEKGYDYLKKKK